MTIYGAFDPLMSRADWEEVERRLRDRFAGVEPNVASWGDPVESAAEDERIMAELEWLRTEANHLGGV
jgi:hypothetical protein